MTARHTHTCPVAATLNVIGDHWTMLILREAFYGACKFSEIQRNTGIARNLLSARLTHLVGEGVLEKTSGSRPLYHLTKRGRALRPVLVAMTQWGNDHLYGAGNEPVALLDAVSGEKLAPAVYQTTSGQPVRPEDIRARPGPGASDATRRRLERAKQC
ncbi:winged helix-turn-helix transcriptional regulator [Phaeobacter marinintestinus]|uniref:winged helix-turn-helix transcriptional regulator n=1 Tax=Falsiphaeobacter marinintestinus TaxID=1492905 RepID=UPI0011B5EF85|nr:helix-turn-helix domain-containing protein [Phaeobacter marinintestinus]